MEAVNGSVTFDRTHIDVKEQEKGHILSEFLITINPNITVLPSEKKRWLEIKTKLRNLNEFLLKEKTIRSLLTFRNPMTRASKYKEKEEIPQTKEWHLERIYMISEQEGSIEYGKENHRLHLHSRVLIEHGTKVGFNIPGIVKIVKIFFPGEDADPYVHVSGNTGNWALHYLRKHKLMDAAEWDE